jgi:hypothetical protein
VTGIAAGCRANCRSRFKTPAIDESDESLKLLRFKFKRSSAAMPDVCWHELHEFAPEVGVPATGRSAGKNVNRVF